MEKQSILRRPLYVMLLLLRPVIDLVQIQELHVAERVLMHANGYFGNSSLKNLGNRIEGEGAKNHMGLCCGKVNRKKFYAFLPRVVFST